MLSNKNTFKIRPPRHAINAELIFDKELINQFLDPGKILKVSENSYYTFNFSGCELDNEKLKKVINVIKKLKCFIYTLDLSFNFITDDAIDDDFMTFLDKKRVVSLHINTKIEFIDRLSAFACEKLIKSLKNIYLLQDLELEGQGRVSNDIEALKDAYLERNENSEDAGDMSKELSKKTNECDKLREELNALKGAISNQEKRKNATKFERNQDDTTRFLETRTKRGKVNSTTSATNNNNTTTVNSDNSTEINQSGIVQLSFNPN